MAEIIGYLREENATYGEKEVLKKLTAGLPADFSVYVECPIPNDRQMRYPDFIVLTTFGVIILEVKDWVQLGQLDRFNVQVFPVGGKRRQERNPVTTARELAIALENQLARIPTLVDGRRQRCVVPWGFAVVFPHLPTSTITQLRAVWGETNVLNLDDLEPYLVTQRLKATIPFDANLHSVELRYIRAVINPVVMISDVGARSQPGAGKHAVILDETQEKIVSEPIQPPAPPPSKAAEDARQEHLFTSLQTPEPVSAPQKAAHFHKLCHQILAQELQNTSIIEPAGWVEHSKDNFPIIQQLGSPFVAAELSWIIEMGIQSLDDYLTVDRRGRGSEGRLSQSIRTALYPVLNAYRQYLTAHSQVDWADIPWMTLSAVDEGRVDPPRYNVILVDEAQDFAPSWISVIKRLIKPEGLLFLADDPMQSIYRYYSWREKGVPVVGRSRWLRVPYRNTREVYQSAYSVIQADEQIQAVIEKETGLAIDPELDTLRRGTRPRLHRFDRLEKEAEFIRSEVERLRLLGYENDDMVILARRTSGVRRLQNHLRNLGVEIETFHAIKGLEYEIVFLSQMQETFSEIQNPDDLSKERRLVYMAMTRSRDSLYLCYEGAWPEPLKTLLPLVDRIG